MPFPIQIVTVSLLILFNAPIAASAAGDGQLTAKGVGQQQQMQQQRGGKAMPIDPLDRRGKKRATGQQQQMQQQRGGKAMPVDPYDRDAEKMPIDPLGHGQ